MRSGVGCRADAEAAAGAHAGELAGLRQELEMRVATLRADVAEWQARAEAAEKELSAVKERAWALMEEKDAQLQAAKAQQQEQREGTPTTESAESPLPLSLVPQRPGLSSQQEEAEHPASAANEAALPGDAVSGGGDSITVVPDQDPSSSARQVREGTPIMHQSFGISTSSL